MKEFKIDFSKEMFSELTRRIEYTRLPAFNRQNGWEMGTPAEFLKDVLAAWSDFYDNWKIQEKYLNSYPQYICEINDVKIHFFHI